MSLFGDLEHLPCGDNVGALFTNCPCFPEAVDPRFMREVLPCLSKKLREWVATASEFDMEDATTECKNIVSSCNWTAIWSKDPLPATMYYAACMSILWGIPAFRRTIKYITRSEFDAKYPEFAFLPQDEQTLLFHFRNTLLFSFVVVKAYRNKGLLIDLVPRLSESKLYTLGGGIGPSTKRRVLIYEREGNIPKRKQPIRVDHVMRLLDSSLEEIQNSSANDDLSSNKASTSRSSSSNNHSRKNTNNSDSDAKNINYYSQYDVHVPTQDLNYHHTEHGHYVSPYHSSQESSNNNSQGSNNSNHVGRVVEFLSHRPADGVTIRTVSIRNNANEELARHAGIMQYQDDSDALYDIPDTVDDDLFLDFFASNSINPGAAGDDSTGEEILVVPRNDPTRQSTADPSSMANPFRGYPAGCPPGYPVDPHNRYSKDTSRLNSIEITGDIRYSGNSLRLSANCFSMDEDDSATPPRSIPLRTENSVLNDFMFNSMDSLFGNGNELAPVHYDMMDVPHHGGSLTSNPERYSNRMSGLSTGTGAEAHGNPSQVGNAYPPPAPRAVKMSRKINRCLSNDDFQIVDAVEQYLIHNRSRNGSTYDEYNQSNSNRLTVEETRRSSMFVHPNQMSISLPPQYRNPHVFQGDNIQVDWEYEVRLHESGDNYKSDSD